MNNLGQIKEDSFPSLYQAANDSSIVAQFRYVNLVRADLILMVAAAFVSSLSFEDNEVRRALSIVSATLLFIAFLVSMWLKFSRFERVWYGARAVSESVKSLAWRYMIGADPFSIDLKGNEAEKTFISRLQAILAERHHLAFDFQKNLGDQISTKMREVRGKTTIERKNLYLEERVKEQRNWYANKASINQRASRRFFLIAIFFQLVAFGVSAYGIWQPEMANFVGFFSAVTASVFSWMQIKKFQELAQAYALTAQELSMIEAKALITLSEKELSEFVADSENAVSREHTMWVARRGEQ